MTQVLKRKPLSRPRFRKCGSAQQMHVIPLSLGKSRMSTQLDTYKDVDDLDPTDELPRLDIVAYEAALAAGEGATAELRKPKPDTDDDNTSEFIPAFPFVLQDAGSPHPELTADLDIILKRIAELESELSSVRLLNTELQTRCETFGLERETQAKAILALSADNARLGEHRSLATEMYERLEEKLCSQSAHSAAQIGELQAQRAELVQQLAASGQRIESLQLDHGRLQNELGGAVALASERADVIASLQSRLDQAEISIARLAQQLALKLIDYDALSKAVAWRNRTIAELRTSAASLDSKLAQAFTNVNDLSSQLATTNSELSGAHKLLIDRAVAIADRDGRVAQLSKDIKQANEELLSLSAQRDEALQTVAAYEQTQTALKNELGQRVQEIGELRGSLDEVRTTKATVQTELQATQGKLADEKQKRLAVESSLIAKQQSAEKIRKELEATYASNRDLARERDMLLPLREELAIARAALKQTDQSLNDARHSLADQHRDFAAQAARVQMLEEQIAAAQMSASELRGEREVLQQALLRTQLTVETHREKSEAQNRLLEARQQEWASVRAQLDSQNAHVESMDSELRTRETQIAELQSKMVITEQEQATVTRRIEQSEQKVHALQQLVSKKSKRIAALKSELAVYAAAVSAIRGNLTQIVGDGVVPAPRLQHVLEPVEHDGNPIMLTRTVSTVGRTQENDISLRSNLISRNHARLLAGPNGVIIEDTDSTNGCFVNGRHVKQQLMRDGDLLSLGDLRFRLRTEPAPDARIPGNVIEISEVRTPAE